MDLRPRRVELNVERLVVDGAGRVDGAALGRALERELGRVLAERGSDWPGRRASLATLDGGTVPNAPGAGALGRALAHSLHRKLAP